MSSTDRSKIISRSIAHLSSKLWATIRAIILEHPVLKISETVNCKGGELGANLIFQIESFPVNGNG